MKLKNRERACEQMMRIGLALVLAAGCSGAMTQARPGVSPGVNHRGGLTLFLAGDVMTGRGIDQVLPHPGDPAIHESYMTSALGYVELAEAVSGPLPRRPVDPAYVWGDVLPELSRVRPEVRIVNLETAITRSDDAWPAKPVHYRMSPGNIEVLTVAPLDCLVLANNHVLDWGRAGLEETLATLHAARLRYAGAGRSRAAAEAPAVIPLGGGGRVLVFALGSPSAGVPSTWAATETKPGVSLVREQEADAAEEIGRRVRAARRPGDIVLVSIHWGSNWGHAIPEEQRRLAHRLIDTEGVDLVHGHSSHHPRVVEVHHGKLVLYGCGDLLNDYEGIGGHQAFRGELGLMYFATLDRHRGTLLRLRMVPTRMQELQVKRAGRDEARWLAETLSREGAAFGTRVQLEEDGSLSLVWH